MTYSNTADSAHNAQGRPKSSSANSTSCTTTAAVAVPITAGIQAPANMRDVFSPVPPLITDDAFLAPMTNAQLPHPHVSPTPGRGSDSSTSRNGTAHVQSQNNHHNSNSNVSTTNGPFPLGAGAMQSATYPYPQHSPSPQTYQMMMSPSPAGMYQGRMLNAESNPYTTPNLQGHLPAVQPTLRGVATHAHPGVPVNTNHGTAAAVNAGGRSSNPSSTNSNSSNNGGAGGLFPMKKPSPPPQQQQQPFLAMTPDAAGVPQPNGSTRTCGDVVSMMGANNFSSLPAAPHTQGAFPYLMPGMMMGNGAAGMSNHTMINNHHNNTAGNMPMMFGMPPSYGAGSNFAGGLPSNGSSASASSSFRYAGGMGGGGNPLAGTGGSLYYGHSSCHNFGMGGVGGAANGSSRNVTQMAMNTTGSYDSSMNPQSLHGSYGMSGAAYGSMREMQNMTMMTGNNNGGGSSQPQQQQQQQKPSSLAGFTGPVPPTTGTSRSASNLRSAGGNGAGRGSQKAFYAAGTESSFYKVDRNGESGRRRPSASVASLGPPGSVAESDLFMQSVTTEMLDVPDHRPKSKKSRRPVARQHSGSSRTSSRFRDGPSPVFSAVEKVKRQHRQRPSSRHEATVSPVFSRMTSQRSVLSGTSQRRLSNPRQPTSCTNSSAGTSTAATAAAAATAAPRPSLLRRFADQVSRIGRDATNGLTRRSTKEKNTRHTRDDYSTYESSRSSSSSSSSEYRSFMESSSSSSSSEDGGEKSGLKNWQQQRGSPVSPFGSVLCKSGMMGSGDATIAQRRNVRVKSLDASRILSAQQDRR